ncbi:phospholipase D-like domain-containing protein [Novosphingobium sp. KCTC 2891]|uniref:phospholipase D-like domain-containing protein n=1 Tax=Novosphingobium sp. KCTC 2891 TaxID=2989730 RepID=UPI00222251CC|nr:phospholipase D-like domain-containing protein [Novosphingobium sp. KCTC 2891]MCW1384818.1 phospholipase D-like domain-containing protein [Novosphingobium sp. KCTC 2891]
MAEPSNDDTPVSPSVWRYARASRAFVVIDAADYFHLMRDAMLAAEQRILLIGWDFDTRILIGDGRRWWNLPRKRISPARLGAFVVWLANRRKRLEVRVLKWNFGAMKAMFRGSMILDLLRWWRHPRIDFKLDSAHPLGCSHHQKIVVIDDKFAVCGGIDMAGDRWDTSEHVEKDPRRRRPGGQLYGPWHDCTMMLEGEVAKVLGDYGRTRWEQAGGGALAACDPQEESPWPARLDAEFHDVEVGIARTRSQYGNAHEVREIEALFIEQIGRARRFIYAENQYFASRKVAEAIALRLAEPDPPEVVLVMPESSHGWLEQTAMDGARIRLHRAVKDKDHAGRFSVWIPYNAGGTPIYVHSKLLIVDDEILRVGSANMNNRSMGLDSECDVFIDAARPGNASAVSGITRLRHTLLAEHCGLAPETVAPLLERHGSMAAMIDASPMTRKCLKRFVPRDLGDTEKALADAEVLDPERPEEMLAFYRRGGLFKSRILRRPR